MKFLKSFFTFFLFLFFTSLPFVAFAQFQDGQVLQLKLSSKKFLIKDGKKWPIANEFTRRELGITRDQITRAEIGDIYDIPNGEVIKISPPRLAGKVDMHEHFRAGGNMKKYLEVAGELGVERTVFVPTGLPPDNAGFEENMKELLKWRQKYPDYIIAFCTVNEKVPEAVAIFEKCLKDGGKGLKLLVGHPEYYDRPIDSPIMKELFRVAQEHDVPVMLHVSIINLPTAKDELLRLLDLFPDVRVQFAHYCSAVVQGVNLNQCAEFLDRYPNLYIDISMGGGIQRYFSYMNKDIKPFVDFLNKYKDRIMYGSDMILARSRHSNNKAWLRARMMCDLSLHQEKWYRCPVANDGQYPMLPGLEFSNEMLDKLYRDNPNTFLKFGKRHPD